MFKKSDYIIISITCLFLGFFIISQFYAGKRVKQLTQPENNEILAVEVARYTTANASLRLEVEKLTKELDLYQSSSLTAADAYSKYLADMKRYDLINGVISNTGQGIIINISGDLGAAKIIDLINAIKNIGAEEIAINDTRVVLNTDLSIFAGRNEYTIKVLGNSKILKSAIERKGGILDLISDRNIKVIINESEKIDLPNGESTSFQYAKIIKD